MDEVLSIDMEPSSGGKAFYLPLAPKAAGEPKQLKIGMRLILTNNSPDTLKVTGITVSFPGTNAILFKMDDLLQSMDPPTGKIRPGGGTLSWWTGKTTSGHQEIFLNKPAPSQMKIAIECKGHAKPFTKTMDLIPYDNPTGEGAVFLPFSAGNLADDEYVVGRGVHHAPGPKGNQIFGHDFAIEVSPAAGVWSRLVEGVTTATEPEHYRVFGKSVYAIADGEVFDAERTRPDNPVTGNLPNAKPNFLWITHGDIEVYYSHFRQDSLEVGTGSSVVAGQKIGEAGNSGNTGGMPHLHMHARDVTTGALRGFAFKRAKVLERAQVLPSTGADEWVWLNSEGIAGEEYTAIRPQKPARPETQFDPEKEIHKKVLAEVFGGIAEGGDGVVMVGGKILKIPPRGPKWALLQSLVELDALERMDHSSSSRVIRELSDAIAKIAKDLGKGK